MESSERRVKSDFSDDHYGESQNPCWIVHLRNNRMVSIKLQLQ